MWPCRSFWTALLAASSLTEWAGSSLRTRRPGGLRRCPTARHMTTLQLRCEHLATSHRDAQTEPRACPTRVEHLAQLLPRRLTARLQLVSPLWQQEVLAKARERQLPERAALLQQAVKGESSPARSMLWTFLASAPATACSRTMEVDSTVPAAPAGRVRAAPGASRATRSPCPPPSSPRSRRRLD